MDWPRDTQIHSLAWREGFTAESQLEAKALADRLEINYTPKHASWLNIAEIELSVLARQGLAHDIATIEKLCQQVQCWQDHRNQCVGTVNWQFRTADARIKLKRLYPVQQPDTQPPEHGVACDKLR